MNRNIAKQFTASLSLLDVASDKTNKYKCFHGEDVQLTVKVVGENERPIDLSNTSVKIYFTLDKNINEPIYRQDTGIVVNHLGIITVMLEKSYIRIGNNTLKIVLYDEDQTVFLQPLIISCIDPLIGEEADLEIPDDIDVRDEIYDIRRIIGDLQDFDDDLGREIIEARNEYATVGGRLDNFDSQLDTNTKYVNVLSKKDGFKTDIQIFKESIQEAYNKSINNTGWRSPLVIEIPSGEYTINDSIIDENLNIEGSRFVFRGQGYQNTKIIFTPESEKFLIENKGIFGFTTFEGISFESNNIGKFMNAVGGGSGNSQSFTFEKCKFENFKNIITVTGGTMCSEITFRDCKINGGDDDSILFSLNNSQSVNWRFFSTDIEAFNGILFNYLAGCTINYYQGSIIPINNGIVMNIDGNANPNLFGEGNAPLLNANGVRFEMRDNTKLINVNQAHVYVTAHFTCCGMGGDNIVTDKFICDLKLSNKIIFDNCYNLKNYKFNHTINESAYVYESYIEFRDGCPDNILENSSVNVVTNIKGNPVYNFINCGINGSTRLGEKSACSPILLTTSRHLIEFNENKKPVFNNIAIDTPFTLEYEIKGIYLCSLELHIDKAWSGGYGGMTFDVKVYNGDKSIMYCNGTLESSKGISLSSYSIFKSIDDDKIIIEFIPKTIWGDRFSCTPHLILEY